MAPTDTPWTRVRIHGRLTCTAPLHIGDGRDSPFAERNYRPDQDPSTQGDYNSVCRDAAGRPYIPGSTLRGWLAARLQVPGSRQPADPALANLARHLFGEAAGDTGYAGRLRCYDARHHSDPTDTQVPHWDKHRHTQVQHGVKLQPRLGTVDGHALHRQEAVPVGTQFACTLEVDDCTEAHLALLVSLLASLDGEAGSGIGRGVSRQAGRLEWDGERIEVLSPQAVAAWLRMPGKTLDSAFDTLPRWPEPAPLPARQAHSVGFVLHPQGPLLVNEPGLCAPRRDPDTAAIDDEERARSGEPNLEFSRTTDGRALVPASTLRGVLRGRARRIAATIAADLVAADSADLDPAQHRQIEQAIDKAVNDLIDALFGATGQRSRIWVTEAVGTKPAQPLKQTFVGIDRFTGGGQPGKLYQARAAESGPLEGTLLLDPRASDLADWERGLLLLLARDALEGDLLFGWGKARGYGACDVQLIPEKGERVSDLDGLLTAIGSDRDAARAWIEALHARLRAALPAERIAASCAAKTEQMTAAEVRHA
jgi:CRISPR/Cas system CSM-associated protein Csm3 (group 7 of RAMP superfamily)